MNSLTIEYPWYSTPSNEVDYKYTNYLRRTLPQYDSEQVYTQYNLKNSQLDQLTNLKDVNYAALNKENGCRKSFIPTNKFLRDGY